MDNRYLRNFNILSKKEQKILNNSKVCIIGLGGLGGNVAEMLARIGIGNLVLVDGDIFETSNLNRQILCTEKLIGTSKSEACYNRIKKINSSIKIKKINEFFTEKNADLLLKDVNLVVDALDSIDDRFILQTQAEKFKIPIVSGAIAGTSGQIITIFPKDQGFNLVYGERKTKKIQGAEKHMGNLCFTACFIASIQVSETIKVLLNKKNILRNKLLIADLMTNFFEIINLK